MGGPNGWDDVIPWLTWLYSGFPDNYDLAVLGILCAFTFFMALRELAIDMGA